MAINLANETGKLVQSYSRTPTSTPTHTRTQKQISKFPLKNGAKILCYIFSIRV